MPSVVNFFKSLRSILCDMSDIKADRSNCRFTVQLIEDGKPVLLVQLYQETIPVLKSATLGFGLLGGTRPEQATKLAELLNEQVLEVFVRTTTDTALPSGKPR